MLVERPDWLLQIKGVGWDVDGTLVPKGAIPSSVIHTMQIDRVATCNQWLLEQAETEFAKQLVTSKSTTKTMTALGVDGEGFFRWLWDTLPLENYICPDQELAQTIEEIHEEGKTQFIVSNSNEVGHIQRKLELLGIDPRFFSAIVSTFDVGVTKPDPLPFRTALKIVNLPANACVYVGDNEQIDIVGAMAVGMWSILVGGQSERAHVSLPSAHDVLALFK